MYIAIQAQAHYVAWSPVILLVSYKAASKLGSQSLGRNRSVRLRIALRNPFIDCCDRALSLTGGTSAQDLCIN